MPSLRETIKRALPVPLKDALVSVRDAMAAPPLEDIVLHGYELIVDTDPRPRLTLVIPSVAPDRAFGGVTTGLDIFLEIGKRTGAQLRVLLDDFQKGTNVSVIEKRARTVGVDPSLIEIVPRRRENPQVGVRASDVFCSFNWWTTLNIRQLLQSQQQVFGGPPTPHLQLIQEYEPLAYPLSSTHMMARLAFEARRPCWGIVNSGELYEFFRAQGHSLTRAFVFEPQLSASLRPFLCGETPAKARRILVYGRPTVDRNCHPALTSGLKLWAREHPEFKDWEVVSAGLPHGPVRLGRGRAMTSQGMLSLDDYAKLLRTTAVGLSLMASPHPSYPPLEMAHFGLRTITNSYANKNLAGSHDNIISIADVAPGTIAEALARACREFEAQPEAGWRRTSGRPSFLDPAPFPFLGEISDALTREVWKTAR